jgi:hypothetical protein
MTSEEFIELVRDVRLTQIEYFSTRDKATLRRSKELERQLDQELYQLANQPREKQLNLLES